jgi:putative acyl-CoA dehydrogenase
VQALDLLRVLDRNTTAYDAWRSEVAAAADERLDAALSAVDALVRSPAAADARQLAVRMVVLLQAALLLQHSPTHVSDAFCRTRLPTPEGMWGMLPASVDARRIVARAAVAI